VKTFHKEVSRWVEPRFFGFTCFRVWTVFSLVLYFED